ncbi:MAG: hypothetical protein GC160_28075 [Acidobacteria bacterium]|nr:hypothetical protein [Acidobacteriota bacterium]
MKDSILRVTCPCCRAELEVDVHTQTAVSMAPGKPAAGPKSLDEELARLKGREAEREEVFQKTIEQNRRKEAAMDRRFADLLKKQKGQKIDRPVREFDLD